jgi:hypothetical protein
MPSACVICPAQRSEELHVRVGNLAPDEGSNARGKACARREIGRHRLVVQVEVKWVAPRGRIWAGDASQYGRGERLEQHAGDPVPEAHAVALGGIVEQGGGEQVVVVLPAPEQPLGDVESVAAIRDRHRFE